MRRWSAITIVAMAVAACSHQPASAATEARRACIAVRSSISGKLVPKRTYGLLDSAVDHAQRAIARDRHFTELRDDIVEFRATLHGRADYGDEARFAVAAKKTKTACSRDAHVDIGVTG